MSAAGTEGRRGGRAGVARNTVWNFGGLGLPAVVALVAVPFLIRGLGTERFAVLALAWGVIGYFSVFDLGLAASVTRAISRIAGRKDARVAGYAWTGVIAAGLLGAVGGALLLAATPWVVRDALTIPPHLEREAIAAMRLLALSLPLVTSTAVLRGVLEAHQWFGIVNAIRLPMGLVTFVGPLLVLPFSTDLAVVMLVLVFGRACGWMAHLAACLHRLPALRRRPALRLRLALRLLWYGGWVTVSALASSAMTYLDRFVIAAMLPVAAVAYYVTPYDAMLRFAMIPGALCAGAFPALAERFRRPDLEASALFEWSGRVMMLALFPAMVLVVAFAPEALTLWVGAEFAREGAVVLQWLGVGVFVFGVAMVGAAAMGAAGRPDISAKLNVAEVPFYLAALFLFTQQWGIAGAALAWTLRLCVDAGALLWLLGRTVPVAAPACKRLAGALGLLAALLAGGLVPEELGARAGVAAASLVVFAAVAGRYLLLPEERRAIFSRMRGAAPAVTGRT